MGDSLSYYGDKMIVKVDFADLSYSALYDADTNSIHVKQSELTLDSIGLWQFSILATYEELDGSEISF
jgi:hypothetical protein